MIRQTLSPARWSAPDLADQFALQRLAFTYCRAVDRRDYVLIRQCYHDDATDDHGGMFRGSPDAFVAWLPGMLARWSMTRHTVESMLFLVNGDDAEGELVSTARHRPIDPAGRQLVVFGRYLDRYERRDSVWRIVQRSLVLDGVEERDAVTSVGGPFGGMEIGRPDRKDASYRHLPMFAL